MLHTFVGNDEREVREIVREPMKRYLASAVDIVKAAEWSFPTIVQPQGRSHKQSATALSTSDLAADELDAVLEHAFERYYRTSGLLGTRERCVEIARGLAALGVDELACLVDFGIAPDTVLAALPALAEVMRTVNSGVGHEPVSVASDIVRHRATHLQCTPSMAAMLLADDEGRAALGRLSAMLVGGEALPQSMAQALVSTVQGPVLNMYGPTETTVWSTTARLAPGQPFAPLGAPIANTSLAVVDANGRACSALVPGELLIGGAGVADGYWQRPDLSVERFVQRNTAEGPRRFYRTGDLVRRHPDGTLEFLGRIDQQVKIRGHRIELGEIEAVLAEAEGVAQAVVVARGTGTTAELAAFVTPELGNRPEPAVLARHLAARLPAIMVPSSISVVEALPQTANRKVDRKALAEHGPGQSPPKATNFPAHPPSRRNGAEAGSGVRQSKPDTGTLLSETWQRLLGRSHIGPQENFFEIGGHSLLAVELHRAVTAELGPGLKLTDIFRYPTLAGLGRHVDQLLQGAASQRQEPVAAASIAPQGADRARMRLAMARRGRGATVAPAGGEGQGA
jgi:hypothetical protein